jgi:hypothetical protein
MTPPHPELIPDPVDTHPLTCKRAGPGEVGGYWKTITVFGLGSRIAARLLPGVLLGRLWNHPR